MLPFHWISKLKFCIGEKWIMIYPMLVFFICHILNWVECKAYFGVHSMKAKTFNITFPLPHFSFSLHLSSVWMSTLWAMELSRQLCGKMRRSSKRAQLSCSPTSTWGLEIHFYTPEVHQLEYFKGCYTALELCVDAAKKCCEWLSCWLVGNIKNYLLCLLI